MLFRLFYESIVQAWQSLVGNRLRTILSLIGISIGIFCIVAVLSAVDSLKISVNSSFEKLGKDVIYVRQMPFGDFTEEEYFEFIKRPKVSFQDYKWITERSKYTDQASFELATSARLVKYRNNELQNQMMMGATYEYLDIHNMKIEKGRYFTNSEYNSGANKVILGHKVAEQLFDTTEPIGRDIKINGLKYKVIGILEYEGSSMFNFFPYDDLIWISLPSMKKIINVNSQYLSPQISVTPIAGVSQEELMDELTGVLRNFRKSAPKEDSNFSLSTLSQLSSMVSKLTGTLSLAGGVIGLFSLVIGMFSVANIMFVSVKERTNIIGVKKALGARSNIILLEFLIEAVVLCIIGGIIGIGLVLLISLVMQAIPTGSFTLIVNPLNIIIGLLSSIFVGIISGIIPAFQASKMDPVEAIRG